jgi:hypothetical protein
MLSHRLLQKNTVASLSVAVASHSATMASQHAALQACLVVFA